MRWLELAGLTVALLCLLALWDFVFCGWKEIRELADRRSQAESLLVRSRERHS